MYVHQYTKEQLNQFTGGAVIGTNAHTHPLLHKPYFPSSYHLDI